MPLREYMKKCSKPGCIDEYEHHRWGNIRAQEAGWFLQKNGDSWCPIHIPEWGKEWRAKKEKSDG